MEMSKLALARVEQGLTQPEVAELVGTDAVTVCRWEKGVNQPRPRHILKLCTLFGKTTQELGLESIVIIEPDATQRLPSESHPREKKSSFAEFFRNDIELRLQCMMYDWLYSQKSRKHSSSRAILQYRINQELKDYSMTNEQPAQDHESVDIARRGALRRLALLPIYALGLDTLGATPKWAPEDLLTHCAAGITACRHLSKGIGEDMSLAYAVLTTYLPPLKEIVGQSSTHRKEAARLVGQAFWIKALLSPHREGPKQAINYGKQAVVYSKQSGDIALRLAILRGLAWAYACDKQEKKALETVLQAKSLLEEQEKKSIPIHPIMQSSILGGMAMYQALNGLDEEALIASHDAQDAFFTSEKSKQSGDDAVIAADFSHFQLIKDEGLAYYHLGQYEQALEVFSQAIDYKTLASKVPASSERVRIEIINNETLASLKRPQKDMQLSIRLWMAGIQGATNLRSEQRFNEALEAYSIMQALWDRDKRIKELRDLTRHW